MTNREFYYWLQGYFELSENVKHLSVEQLSGIANHLSLVRKVDGKLEEFTSWLEGVLESNNISNGIQPLNEEMTRTIRKKLASVFKHEVDPTYPGSQSELNDIHSGGGFNPGGCSNDHMIRC